MTRRMAALAALAGILVAAAGLYALWQRAGAVPASDLLAIAQVVRPSAAPAGLVVLLSDAGGYGHDDEEIARQLAGAGALVVGVDVPKTIAKVETGTSDCVYFIGEIEAVSQAVQKETAGEVYRNPMIAGRGTGATLALALVAQTPDASVGRTIAVDPRARLPLRRELCTKAPHAPSGEGWSYGLPDGPLPDIVQVIGTGTADPEGSRHVADLIAQGHAIGTATSVADAGDALVAAIDTALQHTRTADVALLGDLPLSILPSASPSDTMAIVLSGDGGWRDLDRAIARVLAEKGVPTVGVDSLRYFWSRKPPEVIARDLTRIVAVYEKLWGARRVALIGYSFGADVLPPAYNALPPVLKARIVLVSILAPTGVEDFEFKLSGWLPDWFAAAATAAPPTLPDLLKLPSPIVQCFYGAEDVESICARLGGTQVQVVKTAGGHHFDGDYPALAESILARLR